MQTASSSIESDLCRYFSDSHCHVSTGTVPLRDVPSKIFGESKDSHKSLVVLCGTSEDDWNVIDSILTSTGSTGSQVIGGFGVHPWWASTAQESSFDHLRQLLLKHPTAIVGEIGIDTIRFSPKPDASHGKKEGEEGAHEVASHPESKQVDSMQLQLEVFEKQMAIAAELRRPVSLHVVGKGSYGIIGNYIDKITSHNKEVIESFAASDSRTEESPSLAFIPLPPAMIFHGYTGSLDFAKRLVCAFVLGSRILKSLPPSVKASYPHPDCFFGIGYHTSITSKNTLAVIKNAFAEFNSASMADSTPAHSLQPQNEVNKWKLFPPTALVLESDAYYAVATLPDATLKLQESEEVQNERANVLTVAKELGGADLVQAVLCGCSHNLRIALRSVLHK